MLIVKEDKTRNVEQGQIFVELTENRGGLPDNKKHFVFTLNRLDRPAIEFIPETVGQFTGLHDKKGVEIYEGDIIVAKRNNEPYTIDFRKLNDIADHQLLGLRMFKIDFDVKNGCWNFVIMDNINGNPYHDIYMLSDIEVIGNIIDNPELLQKNKLL